MINHRLLVFRVSISQRNKLERISIRRGALLTGISTAPTCTCDLAALHPIFKMASCQAPRETRLYSDSQSKLTTSPSTIAPTRLIKPAETPLQALYQRAPQNPSKPVTDSAQVDYSWAPSHPSRLPECTSSSARPSLLPAPASSLSSATQADYRQLSQSHSKHTTKGS